MNEAYHEEYESSKEQLASLKKEVEKKVDTVDNINKRGSSILDKATKIKPDSFKKPGMPESTDAYAGYTRKRGNTTYEVRDDYSKTLIIKEADKKECSVVFGFDEIENKPYIIAHDEQGKKYEDKTALNLAKKYVTQFKDALKIQQ